jgi:N,N'-diacetyllegionaminate synthase
MNFPFIIAEIGVNHDGNLEKAKKLILEAKIAGASAVKFQSFSAEKLANTNTPKVGYQKLRDASESHFQMLKSLELSFNQQEKLYQFSIDNNIEFMSTPYSSDQADFLFNLGVLKFKTASADIVDIPLHKKIASFGKPTYISTGMATSEEISQVIKIYEKANCPFILMHTTSEYPCPIDHANMNKLRALNAGKAEGVGFSDHTHGNIAAVVAVGMGCKVFEKHFTLNRDDPGPDHLASSNPAEFKSYVSDILQAWRSLGLQNLGMSSEEVDMRYVSRKSLHYSKNYSRGQTITLQELSFMRPGNGLSWSTAEKLLPRELKVDVISGTQVNLFDFEE